MAGVSSQRSCRGCSATSCACGDGGTWREPSLLSQRLSEDAVQHQLLEEWTGTCSSLSGAAPARGGARPLVFLCAGCRRPLGDSLSWVRGPDPGCILLRSVSCNVSVDEEQILSKRENEDGCILETLHCAGCSLALGYVYRCTPNHLDYKRDLFCLKVEATESYVLGSSEKKIVSDDKEVFNLESRTEIENSLKQMEDVLKILQTKLRDMETKFSFASSQADICSQSPTLDFPANG